MKFILIILLFTCLNAHGQFVQGMQVKKGQLLWYGEIWMALRDIPRAMTPPSEKSKGWWAPLKADYILNLLAENEELKKKRTIIYADSAVYDATTKTLKVYE